MKFIMKLFLRSIILCFVITWTFSAFSADTAVYVNRPAWWAAAPLKMPSAIKDAKTAQELWDILEKENESRGRLVEGWRVIGPLDGKNGNGLEESYSPEVRVSTMALDGQDGQSVTWKDWKPGEPIPCPTNVKDAVFYAYKDLVISQQPGSAAYVANLSVWVNGGAKLWLDKKELLSSPEFSADRDTDVPLALSPGKYRLLLKIYVREGTPDFRMGVGPSDIRRTEVKARSLVCSKFPEDKDNVPYHAERLVELYGQMNDTENAMFWVRFIFENVKDHDKLSPILTLLASEIPESLTLPIYDEFDAAYKKAKDEKAKNLIGSLVIKMAIARNKPEIATRFMKLNKIEPSIEQAGNLIVLHVKGADSEGTAYWIKHIVGKEKNDWGLSNFFKKIIEEFPAGKADVFYKGFAIAYSSVSADEQKRIANQAIPLALGRNDPEMAALAIEHGKMAIDNHNTWQLIQQFKTRQRGASAFAWTEFFFTAESDPKLIKERFNELVSLTDEETIPVFYKAMENAFRNNDKSTCRETLGELFVKLAFGRSDSSRLTQFLADNRTILDAGDLKFKRLMWEALAKMSVGDRDAARTALDEAIAMKPEYKTSTEYVWYDQQVFAMKAVKSGPVNIDMVRDQLVRNIAKSAANNDPIALHRMIRDILTEKGGAMEQDSKDRELFVGSKRLYRMNLQSYRKTYDNYLAGYVRDLMEIGGYSRIEARNRQIEAALAIYKIEQVPNPLGNAAAFPLEKQMGDTFVPLARLEPGVVELEGADTCVRLGGVEPPASFSVPLTDGNLTFIQNSRTIACLRDGNVLWIQAVPHSPAWSSGDNPWFIGAVKSPVVCGDLVIGRFASQNSFELIAMNKTTGQIAWRLRPKDYYVSSDPAVWGNSICCVQATDNSNAAGVTQLVAIDVNKGEEVFRLDISQGPKPSIRYYRDSVNLSPTCNMPAPVVVGNVVFMDTLNGSVAAVNMFDRGIMWLRTYQREKNHGTMARKALSQPVIGSENVLFASSDSSQIILLDRATGKLIGKETSIKWKEAAPAGKDTAVIISGNSIVFYSLKDFSVKKTISRNNMKFLEDSADGCLLFDGKNIIHYSSEGEETARAALPEGVAPIGTDRSSNVFAVSLASPGLVGTLAKGAAPDKGIKAARASLNGSLDDAHPIEMTEGSLVKCPFYLVYFDPAGQPIWEVPVVRNAQVFNVGNIVAVQQAGQVFFHDIKTGRSVNVWPGLDQLQNLSPGRFAKSGNSLFSAVRESAGNRGALYRLYPGKEPARLGFFPNGCPVEDSDIFVMENGDYVVSAMHGKGVVLLKLDKNTNPAEPVYNVAIEYEAKMKDRYTTVIPMPNGDDFWIFNGKQHVGWPCKGDSMGKEVSIPSRHELWRDAASRWNDGLFIFVNDSWGRWSHTYFDPATHNRLEFTDDRTKIRRLVRDRCLYMLEQDKGQGTLIPAMADFTEGKNDNVKIKKGSPIQNPFKDQGVILGPVALGDMIVYPYYYKDWKPQSGRMQACAVIQKKGTAEAEIVPFPLVKECRQLSDSLVLLNGTVTDEPLLKAFLSFTNTVQSLSRDIGGVVPMMTGWKVKRAAELKDFGERYFTAEVDDSSWPEAEVVDNDKLFPDRYILYRKWVEVPESWKGRPVNISFGAVDDNAFVYMNGVKLGEHFGYNEPFQFKASEVKYGEKNLVAVMVDNPTSVGGIWKPVVMGADDGTTGVVIADRLWAAMIDGFLDEWNKDDFIKTGKGTYAVRRENDDIYIGIRITDPSLVRDIAAYGADNNIDFFISAGGKAGFVQDTESYRSPEEEHYYTREARLDISEAQKNIKFAYSVSPSGDSCQMEILVVDGIKTINGRKKKQPASVDALMYGDVAFRLLWRVSPSYPARSLLEKFDTGPFSFSRYVFPFGWDK